jgi:Zn-dependent M16 (insulinase) family peptidase
VAASPATFGTLSEGTAISGFQTVSVYLDAADHPFGARFRHRRTGFTLDLIQLQSVPQTFTYVNTYPTSDKGEPHTQEHLLALKGNQGRLLSESQDMTLTGFNAYTMQWRTCYMFNTQAGPPVFYQEFERLLDALLHPDYSDEEIRREVRNFGIAEDPAIHKLHLEEKGTVYNEMVSTTAQQGWVRFRAIFRAVYGAEHPLAFNQGGEPSGIRELLPADIHKFHREHYFLGNMGSVVSLPQGEALDAALAHLDAILNRVQPEPLHYPVQTETNLPAPKPAPAGSIAIYDFPAENEKGPGTIAITWPADRDLTPREEILFNLFMDNFSSDATSDLYRLFVNSKTRKFDLGASGLSNYVASDPGHLAMIGIEDVAAPNLNERKIGEVRRAILDELARIVAFPDSSTELLEFNTRLRNRITEEIRQLRKNTNSPPDFGARNGSSFWMQHLDRLNKEPGFRKSLTMRDDYAAIESLLAGGKNIWKARAISWRLTNVTPYGIATRPNPALLKIESDERLARANAETRRLMVEYGLSDQQQALRRYKQEYDAKTAELDKLASESSHLKFIDNPPLTLDDQLNYQVTQLKPGVPLVASTFENMTSSTTGLALRLDGVPESDLFLLTLLPGLLTQTGVILDGKPVSYEEMQEMLRKEILEVNGSFSTGLSSNRAELVIRGAGNDTAESRRAVEWIELMLFHPDWRPENLPRIRDLVDQYLSVQRDSMEGAEESWADNPIDAYYKQTNPLYLAIGSFLTRAHNADRLRWMLKDAGAPADRAAISSFLSALAAAAAPDRTARKTLLTSIENGTSGEVAKLTPRAREIAVEAAKDLDQMLPDLPDATLASDWSYLCNRIRGDLAVTPEATLKKLDALRASLLKTGNARMWMVSSSANRRELLPHVQALVGRLQAAPRNAIHYSDVRRIDERLKEHQGDSATPRFVGLFNANLRGGVFRTITPGVSYKDTDRESLLRYLTRSLFVNSVFTKTIASGLAYNVDVQGDVQQGTSGYYADRMPDVTQTLHFVIDTIRQGPRDPRLTEYALAYAFYSRAAASYEARAGAIAANLADGITPDVVKRFRLAILDLRKDPNLAGELFKRVDQVYGPIIPGYGPKAKQVPGAIYYLIGNDKQFNSLDADVQARENERVYKLFPRDYWLMWPPDTHSSRCGWGGPLPWPETWRKWPSL